MDDHDLWTAVDGYIDEHFLGNDPVMDAVLERSAAAGLPAIAVSPAQGKLLYVLARLGRAHRVLEIGTLGGYSAIWMARGLPPHGKVISLEVSPKHAAIARENIASAGMEKIVEVRVGAALDLLPQLDVADAMPFDLVFIDADKENIPQYFEWAVKVTRAGSVIVVDNVVRNGKVLDENADASVRGVRRFNEMVAKETRVSGTTIQTVGSKGYDGFAILMVLR